ncbi:hypothetical protein AK830_g4562 [Neonectria ditissima]|uniref:Uncharacterized protein n=1 Tax=Neonectria ditissima TaxID=78410 RepID=A0A0P7BNG8_9HYPO|nr:hypothetical protein AK830_g4562 [Neonectria ditissima]
MSRQQGYTARDASQRSSGQAVPREYGHPGYQQQAYQQQQGQQQQGQQQQAYQQQAYQQQAYQQQAYQQQVYQQQTYQNQAYQQQEQARRGQQPDMAHPSYYSHQDTRDQDQSYGHGSRYPSDNDDYDAEAGSFRGDEYYADDSNGYSRPSVSSLGRTALFAADQSRSRPGGSTYKSRTRREHKDRARKDLDKFDKFWSSSNNPR